MKKVVVALTGASGNMGKETLVQLAESESVAEIKLLLLGGRAERKLAAKWSAEYGDKVSVIFGNVANRADCDKLVENADYVLNLAAVIPPRSDKYPERSAECNVRGVEALVGAIEALDGAQPKLVHVSTVAVYGNRNYLHPWGRVGDPLLPSIYDCYAADKTKGERRVLESTLTNWAVLRQTAMLHSRMLTDNMSDGLMFHTCYNVPLEWVTARDSGRLMTHLVERDTAGEVDGFWKKVYNIGGGACNRVTGYDTFDAGFEIIGGSVEKFMKPTWNSIRNFHGMWFSDSNELEKLFGFQKESVKDYWQEILRKHPYYRVAKLLPPSLISKLAVQRLLGDENAPRRWIAKGEYGKVRAYFGSEENIGCLPVKWSDYPVLAKGELADSDIDYDALRDEHRIAENGLLLSHGYDESKGDENLDIEDMRSAAEFRGGKCLSQSMTKGDLYTKLLWECHDGHPFYASPYTVLKAGHWCEKCCESGVWDFDRLAKFMPFYAQIWYDTHAKAENGKYYFDSAHRAKLELYI